MALVLNDRVLETCTSPGVGAVTLLGAATGYRTFSAGVGNTNTCYYALADQSGPNWEIGIGTYATAGNTLTRTTVLASSNAGSLTNFSTGTQNIFVTYPASKAVYLDANGAYIPASPVFNGNAIISDNSSNAALRVTQVGSGNAFLVEDSGSPDSTPFLVDASGFVVQGKTTARTNYFVGTTTAPFQGLNFLSVDRGGAFDAGPAFILSKNRGATGDNTVVVAADTLGQISFQGADGTNLIPGAAISALVDGTPGLNDMPGRLMFSTTAEGASSPTERMRIDNAGNVAIGTTNTAVAKFYVASGNIASDQSVLSRVSSGLAVGSRGFRQLTDGSEAFALYNSNSNVVLTSANPISLGGIAGSESLRVTPVASAVNYVLALGATTGNSPNLSVEGSDTNINFIIKSKGTGVTGIYGNQVWLANLAGERQFVVTNTASAVNYHQMTGSATGTALVHSAQGSDTNIDLALTPKGTGVVQYGTYTAGVVVQTGYITIKDAGGTTRRLLVG